MKLDGMIPTKCPPADVARMLFVPSTLRKLLPVGCQIDERDGDTIPFVLRRTVGPVRLNMPGTLTMTERPDGSGFDLLMEASHLVAGRIRITMLLQPGLGLGNLPRLKWQGQVESHGLAARLIADRTTKIKTAVTTAFVRLHALTLAA